jgi:hypothetical protein
VFANITDIKRIKFIYILVLIQIYKMWDLREAAATDGDDCETGLAGDRCDTTSIGANRPNSGRFFETPDSRLEGRVEFNAGRDLAFPVLASPTAVLFPEPDAVLTLDWESLLFSTCICGVELANPAPSAF